MTFVVGLTGGIGSGKTTVANAFADQGIVLVDADIIARQVVEPGSEALQGIAAHFGAAVIRRDGSLDRDRMRQLVFKDPAQRRWLEQLLHPLIRQETERQLAAAKSPYVLLVSPLLLETDQHLLAQRIVVVDLPEALQMSRTMDRDSNDPEQVRAIIDTQIARSARVARADDLIDNSGEPGAILPQVIALDKKLRQRALTAAHPLTPSQ